MVFHSVQLSYQLKKFSKATLNKDALGFGVAKAGVSNHQNQYSVMDLIADPIWYYPLLNEAVIGCIYYRKSQRQSYVFGVNYGHNLIAMMCCLLFCFDLIKKLIGNELQNNHYSKCRSPCIWPYALDCSMVTSVRWHRYGQIVGKVILIHISRISFQIILEFTLTF